eukprot:TRINITY_DN67931_c0_g1_i1.p1 TRINITY_DN67931_c0_g1~~TRINITY_DN67931_c0_g1_i1.p1  ORF type:complete len:253 (-),score=50.49 TRINITY_DN67931_c0_g1_i1:46-756(-)
MAALSITSRLRRQRMFLHAGLSLLAWYAAFHGVSDRHGAFLTPPRGHSDPTRSQLGGKASLATCIGASAAALSSAEPALAATVGPRFELFGQSAAELFPVSNISILTWLLLLFVPSWENLKPAALVAPVINALLYAVAIAFILSHPAPDAPAVDFGSLEGIVTAFRNPDGVFAGWLHYCVFDPLVGLGEVLDSQQNKVPHQFVVPCLLLTLLFGPVGFLSYLGVRTLVLATREQSV